MLLQRSLLGGKVLIHIPVFLKKGKIFQILVIQISVAIFKPPDLAVLAGRDAIGPAKGGAVGLMAGKAVLQSNP